MIQLVDKASLTNGKIAAKVLYGTITLLAVLVGLEDHPPKEWEVILVLAVSALGVMGAKFYSELIAKEIDRGQRLNSQDRRELWSDISAVFVGVQIPLLFFTLSFFELIRIETAFTLSKWGMLFVLFLFGFVSRFLCGRNIVHSLAVGLISTIFGALIIQVKLLAH